MGKDNIEAIYPLSPVQHGILFHANFEQRPGVYVESLNFSIHGDLDIPAFRDSWRKVIERHSALRTFFVWKDREKPLQIVQKKVEIPWKELDWRQLSEEDQRDRLEWLLKSDHKQGFTLSKAPLLHLKLIRLSEDTYQFIWTYHHIVLDGWSLAILLDEVFTLYQASKGSLAIPLRQPQPYKNYINWLREQDLQAAEIFWKRKLKDVPTPPLIAVDESLTGRDRSEAGYASQKLRLSTTTSIALQSLVREHKLTLSTLFQGAWALLLSRYTGEDDVVFGTAVSGRSISLTGMESMVGLLIGSLPARVQISPRMSLIPWLKELQSEQLQTRQYEYSSLRDIQTWSGINRSQGQSLFDTILSFNNYGLNEVIKEASGDLEIQNLSSIEGSHYPLTILIVPDKEIQIRINYDCSRFDDATIDRILQHLQVLLEDMAENSHKSLSEFSLLSEVETQKLLIEYNSTEVEISTEKNVICLFEEQAKLNPDAVALRYRDQIFSYGQLNDQANQLAHSLKRHGVGPEKIVALCLDRSPQAVIAILGTLKAGGGYLPLDAMLPTKRLGGMLEETGAPVVLTTQYLAKKLPTSIAKVIRLDADWQTIESESVDNLPLVAGTENIAYIIYTSGSTGKPKGTIIRHRNLLNYVMWARDFYLQGEKLDFPLFSSMSFDLTVTSIYVPLISGGSIVIYGEDETANLEVLDIVNDDLVDIIKLTPAHLSLLQAAGVKAKRLRKMIVGGEDFKRSLAMSTYDLFDGKIEIYNEYGPTEATVGCMIHRFDPLVDTDASVPIGMPINNAQIYVLDKHLKPVPPGVIGEMCIGGAGVARGYLHRPDLTANKFVDHPFKLGASLYRTGDLARWTEDGRMQFLGRSDHQVKIKGFRIELGEIENCMLNHPDIEAAVVAAVQSQTNKTSEPTSMCTQCGLPDNYPGVSFDAEGVCNTCRDFNVLKERFQPYFKTPTDLQLILDGAKKEKSGKYDCMVLYSGGKDSSFMLHQLVREYGMTPLVFSLDNGYISEEAKGNVRRITDDLEVDLIFGETPHMNAVFADSLRRHSNVCDGCFKVIYTLSINLARKNRIKYIFTGLSRGQLFETRLSDMFQARIFDVDVIDQTVLAARKAYHRFDDAVTQLMDVKIFEDDTVFDDVQLIDFYRYVDVPLDEVYKYLDRNAPWVRPSDTGRSTNCLINDVGIYIHQKERGFHNYALPYSWDVRIGHKTRGEALDELNDDINEANVHRMLAEIGYDEDKKIGERPEKKLVAYYVSHQPITSNELRKHLSEYLPDYMMPEALIQLDEMPLTVNGKIDRSALPDPDQSRSKLETGYVAPSTENETKLAEIWSQIFQLPEVGIHDNFFDLGGDSIISIQIVAKAKQIGLHFTPRDIFDQQTISQLALVSNSEQITEAEQGLVTGVTPLTPIQYWFFEQGFTQPHHWNQTLWLDVPANVNKEALHSALKHMSKQHDALRSQFHGSENGEWDLSIPVDSVPLSLEFHDLTGMSKTDREEAMQERVLVLESSLNLENGPLLKAALFALGPNESLRLVVTCHHLVVDGISWQPLLSDWETAYHQIRHGQAIHLPPKTTSFKEWANKLIAFAKSPALDDEIQFWQSEDVTHQLLPVMEDENSIGTVSTVSQSLSDVSTALLMHEVHNAYNTNVVDLLLTAWAQAFSKLTGSNIASIMLEGHGRDTEIIGEADLSHTVGWFTTHYPVHIQMTNSQESGAQLKLVKEQLRRIPNNGIGYGLLRYLRGETSLATQSNPGVLFNYMGQFERALPASDLFKLAQPLRGAYSPIDRRTHALVVNAYIRDAKLHVDVSYSTCKFKDETVQKLANNYITHLEMLIQHCLSPDAGGHTPSDFALADLSEEQFDRLSDKLNQLDDK